MNKKVASASLFLLSFLQAVGVATYIGLVSLVFWRGNEWFGPMNPYLGPVLVLTLLAVSTIVCAVIVFAKPFLLWQAKKPKKALKLVICTALWLVVIFFLILAAVLLF